MTVLALVLAVQTATVAPPLTGSALRTFRSLEVCRQDRADCWADLDACRAILEDSAAPDAALTAAPVPSAPDSDSGVAPLTVVVLVLAATALGFGAGLAF